MKVIGYTDVVQVAVLIVGGLVTTYLALNLVSEHFGYGDDVLTGARLIYEKADSHFHMIFDPSHEYYSDLPVLSVLIGGMWINNLSYRSEEHTSELQSLMRISYAVFCLKKKK